MSDKITIAYQGEPGAYSDLTAAILYPGSTRIGYTSFEETLAAETGYVILPVTNNTAGPVITAIELLKESDYTVVKIHWQSIRHALLALPAAKMRDIRTVHSHWQALKQCQQTIEKLGLLSIEEEDTAGAARMVAAQENISQAAIASKLAAEEHGLHILKENIQDDPDNKTLFFVLSKKEKGEAVKDTLKRLGLT
jgi:prephenate dehydratase